jgi:23S rRNA A2030 N6-methylase RlmJ
MSDIEDWIEESDIVSRAEGEKQGPRLSHWNYRVLERETESGGNVQAIYEVYYDENGDPVGHTQKPATAQIDTEFESREDLKEILQAMKQAADKPVLTYDTLEEAS